MSGRSIGASPTCKQQGHQADDEGQTPYTDDDEDGSEHACVGAASPAQEQAHAEQARPHQEETKRAEGLPEEERRRQHHEQDQQRRDGNANRPVARASLSHASHHAGSTQPQDNKIQPTWSMRASTSALEEVEQVGRRDDRDAAVAQPGGEFGVLEQILVAGHDRLGGAVRRTSAA